MNQVQGSNESIHEDDILSLVDEDNREEVVTFHEEEFDIGDKYVNRVLFELERDPENPKKLILREPYLAGFSRSQMNQLMVHFKNIKSAVEQGRDFRFNSQDHVIQDPTAPLYKYAIVESVTSILNENQRQVVEYNVYQINKIIRLSGRTIPELEEYIANNVPKEHLEKFVSPEEERWPALKDHRTPDDLNDEVDMEKAIHRLKNGLRNLWHPNPHLTAIIRNDALVRLRKYSRRFDQEKLNIDNTYCSSYRFPQDAGGTPIDQEIAYTLRANDEWPEFPRYTGNERLSQEEFTCEKHIGEEVFDEKYVKRTNMTIFIGRTAMITSIDDAMITSVEVAVYPIELPAKCSYIVGPNFHTEAKEIVNKIYPGIDIEVSVSGK
jgi:hypothetical protein